MGCACTTAAKFYELDIIKVIVRIRLGYRRGLYFWNVITFTKSCKNVALLISLGNFRQSLTITKFHFFPEEKFFFLLWEISYGDFT